jgi:hypothetical protein
MADSQSTIDRLVESVAVLLAVAFLAACAWCYAREEGALWAKSKSCATQSTS